ncbi:MAG: ZIP family metal transporter [Clostridia bacterium]|nr:ZIP family metal transporter [Clostridia bacterium]
MNEIFKTTILGLFFGTFGTTLGGIIGIIINKNSNKFLSTILSFAAGLMMAIISFELIPEALSASLILNVVIGIILGIITMIYCNYIVDKKFKANDIFQNKRYIKNTQMSQKENSFPQKRNNMLKKEMNFSSKRNNEFKKEGNFFSKRNNGFKKEGSFSQNANDMLKTGIIISIGLAIHNFPEGLAIGSGLEASFKLGLSLAIAICFHDIPEGISMSVPMKSGGMKPLKIMYYVILSGITTGIGAFFGALIGRISEEIIGICLSFAAGAMLYIVACELTPEANKLYDGKVSTIANALGFILGIIVTRL